MNEILTELTKPVWWVSVVIAGIAINLLSAYLKTPLDKTILSTSSWWMKRSATRQKQWEARVDKIRVEARNSAALLEVRQRLQSIHILLLAIFFLLFLLVRFNSEGPMPHLLTIFILGFASITFFASFLIFLDAVNTKHALSAANEEQFIQADS